MRVTADTNVLVSATFWKGDSNTILEKVEKKETELVLSKEILEEFTNVLHYKEIQEKVKNKGLEMMRTVEKIVSVSIIVNPTERLFVVKEDPEDNKILECAKAGGSEYVVTKDNHLLKLKQFEKIKIISPKEFLAKL